MAFKISVHPVRSYATMLITAKSVGCKSQNKLSATLLKKPEIMSTFKRNVFIDKYDPPYLESMKSKIPIYETLNIQIKGYDFALVENYQSLIHSIANTMDLDVEECWATPATKTKILRYKPRSALPEAEYHLSLYERNVQIADAPSTTFALYLELIQAALPQGVSFKVIPHEEEYEEVRYVPDYELDELKSQLTELIDSRKK